jgi:hypothetical protein
MGGFSILPEGMKHRDLSDQELGVAAIS